MESLKITPLIMQEFADIYTDCYDETDRVSHAGMIAAKCVRHPEYGDIILISSTQEGGLMIHS